MARRRPRALRPEEEELWQRVARSLTPMHPARPHPGPEEPDRPVKHDTVKHDPTGPAPLPEFQLGQSARPRAHGHDLAPSVTEHLHHAPVRMDRKQFTRMNRGKLTPERRLDLHGMTLAEAHPELIRFVLTSHAAGKRLVLVITGKGRDGDGMGPIPTRRGILRHQVPHWLSAPPLGAVVLQVTPAHRKHGGEGAFYVYLRRAPGSTG
ncbi:Smr/MutS family protein [Acidimangrovimonas pyrenivorans]|uniref:Smr/MutS family protein n=1 Tax=Acidimangrovimonas pyrenivorans TaxID=2030798 RepID=A0ABV7ALY2_9RHOB